MKFSIFTEDAQLRREIQETFDKIEKKLKKDPRTMYEIGDMSIKQYLNEKLPVVRKWRTSEDEPI